MLVKYKMTNKNIEDTKKSMTTNIPLLLIDLIFLPIHAIRLFLIYLYGSKYNLKGFQFLDVIMHADNPYFNQEHDGRMIDTIGHDYRVVLRDDSRIYPIDIAKYFGNVEIKNKEPSFIESVTIGTIDKTNDWHVNTEHVNIDTNIDDENIDEMSDSDETNSDTSIESYDDNDSSYKTDDVLNSIQATLNSVFEK